MFSIAQLRTALGPDLFRRPFSGVGDQRGMSEIQARRMEDSHENQQELV